MVLKARIVFPIVFRVESSR